MNDDWRLQVDLRESGHVHQLRQLLGSAELEHSLSTAYADRLIVSHEGERIFIYAGSREQAEGARDLVEGLDAEHGWEAAIELRHWHHDAEDWGDPDRPLPHDAAERKRELEARESHERLTTELSGIPDYEVRIDLPSRHDAGRFAEQLQTEGLPTVHRWRYVLIGAESEADAEQLADRIRAEAPAGSKVAVEGTWRSIYRSLPPNPFAFLGGLADS
jgi:hypothetical protein